MERRKNPWKIEVTVGDIIDMRGCELLGIIGRQETSIRVRAEHTNHIMQLFAPKECIDLITARVTKIVSVSTRTKKVRGMYREYTNIRVELENAWGETPTLICENSPMLVAGKDHSGSDTVWKRPEFTTGDVKNGEKET